MEQSLSENELRSIDFNQRSGNTQPRKPNSNDFDYSEAPSAQFGGTNAPGKPPNAKLRYWSPLRREYVAEEDEQSSFIWNLST